MAPRLIISSSLSYLYVKFHELRVLCQWNEENESSRFVKSHTNYCFPLSFGFSSSNSDCFVIFAKKPSVQFWESSELDDSRPFLSLARRPLLGISINLRVSPEIPKCATVGIVDDGEFKAVIRSWIILRDAKLLSVAANLAGNGYLSCNLLTWGIGEAFCCNKIGWFAALLCSYARKFQYFASKQLPTRRLVRETQW